MVVRQSEFARMCGVTAARIGQAVKKGTLALNARGRINTLAPKNEEYLRFRQRKMFRKKKAAIADFNAEAELGSKLYSREALELLAACRTIMKYVEEREREKALAAKVIHKPASRPAMAFLKTLTDSLAAEKQLDNEYINQCLMDLIKSEYRIPYLRALYESRNGPEAAARLDKATGGQAPGKAPAGKARTGRTPLGGRPPSGCPSSSL